MTARPLEKASASALPPDWPWQLLCLGSQLWKQNNPPADGGSKRRELRSRHAENCRETHKVVRKVFVDGAKEGVVRGVAAGAAARVRGATRAAARV